MNIDPATLGINGLLVAALGVVWKMLNAKIIRAEKECAEDRETLRKLFNRVTQMEQTMPAHLDSLPPKENQR